jgi:hypothetical protein
MSARQQLEINTEAMSAQELQAADYSNCAAAPQQSDLAVDIIFSVECNHPA